MIEVKKMYLVSALALSLALTGCSSDSTDTAEKAGDPAASHMADSHDANAPHTMQVGEPVMDDALTGTVVETFNSGGYTYMQLDNGTDKIWAAIGQAQVEKGQEISLANGPVMKDFHSPSLNRTFPEIVFSSGMQSAAGMASPHGTMMPQAPATTGGSAEENFMAALTTGAPTAPAMDPAATTGGSTKAIVSAQELKVAKAEGATGRTVEQIFAEAEALSGQKVKVRGKVVKVSPGIMGVNWLHLQDGSGNAMQNTHDLVVTSDDVADVDSIIVVEGTVASKKDFGMGYYYEALVEKAVISK